jgi:DNA polymerase III subunit epsilon
MMFEKLIARFRSTHGKLSDDDQKRVMSLSKSAIPNREKDANKIRWVIADVETSGLNIASDRLIAIGAVAVTNGVVDLSDSVEIILRQDAISSADNILIHRIGGDQQRCGQDPQQALIDFLHFIGDSPLVGYHAQFDEAMVNRALKTFLKYHMNRRWLDLAMLAPALIGAGQLRREDILRGKRAHALDWWLEHFQIRISKRHHAAADALATAQLMTALLSAGNGSVDSASQPQHLTAGQLFKAADDYAWTVNQRRF